jgi:hypothetical protein
MRRLMGVLGLIVLGLLLGFVARPGMAATGVTGLRSSGGRDRSLERALDPALARSAIAG